MSMSMATSLGSRVQLAGVFGTRRPQPVLQRGPGLQVQAAQRLMGKVVSIASNKTAVVAVESWSIHPVYKKRIRTTKRYPAHDEADQARVGDVVELAPSRPLSARKRFIVDKILNRED
ncbi:PRPS17 [Auxenochlorella protothecoides x Auxenochlorella symbiontica]